MLGHVSRTSNQQTKALKDTLPMQKLKMKISGYGPVRDLWNTPTVLTIHPINNKKNFGKITLIFRPVTIKLACDHNCLRSAIFLTDVPTKLGKYPVEMVSNISINIHNSLVRN